jgi:hypothetical protein
LKAGNHQVALFGVGADGAREELGYQTLLLREP